MAAELKAIADSIFFGKLNITGSFKILSDSVEAIHSIHTSTPYKGVEEHTIHEIKNKLKDSQVSESGTANGAWTVRLIN